jgi:hypothetical protein
MDGFLRQLFPVIGTHLATNNQSTSLRFATKLSKFAMRARLQVIGRRDSDSVVSRRRGAAHYERSRQHVRLAFRRFNGWLDGDLSHDN